MAAKSENIGYKESLKATSLFGGVQLYTILIGIIRSKFVAVLLGPEGMGISGLLTSTIGIISSFTSLGIGTSAVKDIAEANGTRNIQRISLIISVFRKLVWITGLLGSVICFIFSSFLSQLTFGNKEYTIAFMILSSTLLFQQLTSGQSALFQGMRKYAYMAQSSVIGNSIGLLTTIPLYYFWGIDGIVPVLVISSLVSLLLSYYFFRKVNVEPYQVSVQDVKREGKGMIKMGFFISLNGIFAVLTSYIVRLFISNYGSVADVGLYSAGFTIVNTYVGLIFTAMGTDYYPRLSEANMHSTIEFNQAVNTQTEISLLLLSPIIAAFIIFIKWGVIILYSTKFLVIESMIYWAIFAIFFKATSWAIAFSFLAKGDTKIYFVNEFVSNIYFLLINISCYYLWGLTGMGISYLLCYTLYLIQVWMICSKKYSLKISRPIFRIFVLQFVFSSICILLVLFASEIVRYFLGSLIVIISFYYSYKRLNEKIDIVHFIKRKIGRK